MAARSDVKLRDHYDWVALGDHPGTLLSAVLAARLGLSVLVLPLGRSFGSQIAKSGQCLDPESNFLMGLGRSSAYPGLISECLHRLGILRAETESILEAADSLPQVATPRHRLTLSDEQERLQQTFSREFGDEMLQTTGLLGALSASRAEYERFWLELPGRLTLTPGSEKAPTEPLSLKSLRSRIGRATRSEVERVWSKEVSLQEVLLKSARPELAEVFAGIWYGTSSGTQGHAEFDQLTTAELMQLLALSFNGASFRGGLSAYREFLLRLARRHGAVIPAKAECQRIFIENGTFAGVQMAQRGEMITVTGGAIGCALDRAEELMTQSGRPWHKPRVQPRPVGWKFTVALMASPEAVPPGLTRRLVWQERGAPPLEVECVKPADYGLTARDSVVLFLRTILPFTDESLAPAHLDQVAARMLRQVSEIIPFLEYHILRIYPDFRSDAEVLVGERMADVYGFASTQMIPENLRCYSGAGMGSRTGIEGLFVASGEAYPELGSLGGAVAAIEGVAWLAHRSGLPGPLS
ncbi:MAG: hypothetical protein NDJ90_00830 [Oligoflexia bacterium]|nr:hypothetical protein [Oligoflexia bacterium]